MGLKTIADETLHQFVGAFSNHNNFLMTNKKIMAEKSESQIIAKAISNSENEKLDILSFVLGGTATVPVCNEPPGYQAYADCTYVKKTED